MFVLFVGCYIQSGFVLNLINNCNKKKEKKKKEKERKEKTKNKSLQLRLFSMLVCCYVQTGFVLNLICKLCFGSVCQYFSCRLVRSWI